MSSDSYNPDPLDTSSVRLDEDIVKLSHLLAENAHDKWARKELDAGWRFGKIWDDEHLHHPSLQAFDKLLPSKQESYRNTSLDTIKSLLALGYKINCPEGATIVRARDLEEQSQRVLAELKSGGVNLAQLRQLWEQRLPLVWAQTEDTYRRAVDIALKYGEGFLAFDIAEEGLQAFKNDLRLIQLQALALARTGATRRANAILEQLRLSGHQDEETLGILARTHKDFWQLASDPEEAEEHLRIALELYTEAYRRNNGYYSAINAATLGLIYGEKEAAQELAEAVSDICETSLKAKDPDDGECYWLEATLAEAALIQGQLEKAEEWYRTASRRDGISSVVLSRTRSQAQFLLEHVGEESGRLDNCFDLPRIGVFSGHMFDRPDRPVARFPHSREEEVRADLEQRMKEHNIQVGFSSLACGADFLFAENLLKNGGEVNIVLPFKKEDFIKGSVSIFPNTDWVERFEHILKNAATVTVLNELGDPEDPAAYDFCNHALTGLALLKAKFLGMDVMPLVVWDGKIGDGVGGTASFVQFWRERRGAKVEIVYLGEDGVELDETTPVPAPTSVDDTQINLIKDTGNAPQETKAMLFADIVGYTKLSEVQIPSFVKNFLGQVAEIMDGMGNPPVHQNTWGDAVCCVFDHVKDAGAFGLKLRDLVRGTNWTNCGLPAELSIRIALHAGPVFPCFDPVLKKMVYNGSHVNRTARIEPIAEEGQIYASEAFAALATADDVEEFVCDYVGTKQLAKKYGAIPVFLVRATA